jgi:hypothetical protein
VRDVCDLDGGALVLSWNRNRDEPTVALFERGTEITLRASDRRGCDGMESPSVGRSIDGHERVTHDFTFSPAGS